MANDIPDLMAVRYKGSGNVQVYPLLNGTTLGAQDGDDVGNGSLPGLEVPLSTDNNHANRIVEAFGKRFLLHGYRVYERNAGGDGKWAQVDGGAQSATGLNHSGLHVIHPNGVETLAFLFVVSGILHTYHTTDGVIWTDTNTSLATGTIVSRGASIAFRDSIFWWAEGTSVAFVRSYDFKSSTAFSYGTVGFDPDNGGYSAFHVHQNELFLLHQDGGDDTTLRRLDGTVLNVVIQLDSSNPGDESAPCMFSDGNDIIVFHPRNGTIPRAFRVSNVLFGESVSSTDIGASMALPANAAPIGFYPFVAAHPSPAVEDQRNYFWHRIGHNNAGSFNLYRYNYRKINTGVHTGSYILGETVTGGTSGATGVITDIVVNTSLSLTNVTGTFQTSEVLTGAGGATSTSSSTLTEQAVTSLGVGISAVNYGMPQITNGGLNRIPSLGSARPAFNGAPTEVVGGRRRPFVIWGTEATGGDIDVALYYSANGEAPDQRGTISAISVADIPVTTGLVGNLGEVALEALSPTAGDAYVVSNVDGDGSLTPGALSINEGDIVEYDGANWTFVHATTNPTAGVPDFTVHAKLSTDTALIAPYADGTDDGKTVAFDGTSLTGILLSTPSVISNEARDLTPTNGATTYYITHNSAADGLSSGDRVSVILDIV